jgi:hypothetical protein
MRNNLQTHPAKTTRAAVVRPARARAGMLALIGAALTTSLLLAANNRYCGWIGVGNAPGTTTCATDPDGVECTPASAGGICNYVDQVATCYDGGTTNCSTGFWGIGSNCSGKRRITQTCVFVVGAYSATCACQ